MKPALRSLTALFAAVCASALPCSAQAAAETYLALVDVSGSISSEDRSVYRESFGNLLKALKPGDRVVVAPIGKRARSEWVREADATVPTGTGKRFADEKAREAFDGNLAKAFAAVLERSARSPEPKTHILDSLEAASDAFDRAPRGKHTVVIMSDMLESGRFDVASGADRRVSAPKSLNGAAVYVVGAGGGRDYGRIESFWKDYFSSAGADVRQYGRYPAELAKRGAR